MEVKKGMRNVVATTTRLSDVQGEKGELSYAGYDINELADKVASEEVTYLLHHGYLPNRQELLKFKRELAKERSLPPLLVNFIKQLPKECPPMHVLRTGVSILGCLDPEAEDSSLESQRRKAIKLIAKLPIITAYFHLARQGLPLPEPRKDLGEAAHFLYLINGKEPTAEAAQTLDMCYVLHADHGMNTSTFAARVTIGTLSDIYSAVTSAIGTLKGPLHGSANEGVIKMLLEIGSLDKVDAWIENALAQRKKIMGFGHPVYKTIDPRTPILKKMATQLSHKIGEPKWIQMSERIAQTMFERKKLYANVDFYSATVYYSLGLPVDLFPTLFAMARVGGWTAHALEQLSDNKLICPDSEYIGPKGKKVVPIDQRKPHT